MIDIWATDVMSDRLFDEKLLRISTIVNGFTTEALAPAAGTTFRAYQVIDELDRLARIELDRSRLDEILRLNSEDYDNHTVESDRQRIRELKYICIFLRALVSGEMQAAYVMEKMKDEAFDKSLKVPIWHPRSESSTLYA